MLIQAQDKDLKKKKLKAEKRYPECLKATPRIPVYPTKYTAMYMVLSSLNRVQ